MSTTNENHLSAGLLYNEDTADSLQMLLQNISRLDSATELRSLLEQGLGVVEQVMHVEASSLMLLDEPTVELFVSMPAGPVHREISSKPFEKGCAFDSWSFKNGTPYFSNDPSNDESFTGDLASDITTRNIICAPMINKRGELFGMLQAINREDDREFNDQDAAVFEALTNHVAIAVERVQELEKMRRKLEDKEISLTEVHHRLKNNLSTITALIEMELADIEDQEAARILQKTCNRIDSMTEVHNLLYNSDLDNDIDLGQYLKRLSEKICDMLKRPTQEISIEVEAESILLDSERTMSCGLLLNELLVNCYKHAFNEKSERGHVSIELSLSENKFITLKVSDDGVGVGEKFRFEDSDNVGGWLVNVLLRRLEAAIDITHSNGTTFIIRFKK